MNPYCGSPFRITNPPWCLTGNATQPRLDGGPILREAEEEIEAEAAQFHKARDPFFRSMGIFDEADTT